MIDLKRKKQMREEARQARTAARKAERVGRTGQVVRSTVETAEGDVPVVDALTGGAESVEVTGVLLEDVDALDYGLGLDDLDQYQDAEDAAHEVQYRETETQIEVGEDLAKALQDADKAVENAANAVTTSNGKNSRRRGVTEPEPPPGGWVQGDQWVRDIIVGGVPKPTEVLVWNGVEFVHETMLTGEILVVGADGNVRIANGKVTAQSLAVDAIDGKVITGAIIRTAAAGQRLQFDTNGLRVFNASGQVVADLNAYAGGFLLNGGITDRSTVGSVPTDATLGYGQLQTRSGETGPSGRIPSQTRVRASEDAADAFVQAYDVTALNRVSNARLNVQNGEGLPEASRFAELNLRRVSATDVVSTLDLGVAQNGAYLRTRGVDLVIGDDQYEPGTKKITLVGSEIVLDAPVKHQGDIAETAMSKASGITGTLTVEKSAGWIHITADVLGTIGTSGHVTLGSLPDWARPPSGRRTGVMWVGGARYGAVAALDTGVLAIANLSTVAGDRAVGSLSYKR